MPSSSLVSGARTTASRPPRQIQYSLQSLPLEILDLVIYHLDRPAAIALARVSPAFTAPAQARIWRQVNLSVNPHYGKEPRVCPHEEESRGHRDWMANMLYRASCQHDEAMAARVKTVMLRADERRLGTIEHIKLVSRPTSVHAVLQFLNYASPNLRSLEIGSYYPVVGDWDDETLDLNWLIRELSFPLLTHLRIGNDSLRFAQTLAEITRTAPQLVSLDVDLQHWLKSPWLFAEPGPLRHFPRQERTRIRKLRLKFGDAPGAASNNTEKNIEPALALLEHCPDLERLTIQYDGSLRSAVDRVTDVIDKHKTLQRLFWPFSLRSMEAYVGSRESASGLTVIVIYTCDWSDMLERIPSPAHLESMVLLEPYTKRPPISSIQPTIAQAMLPSLSNAMRRSRQLRTIQTVHTLENDVDKGEIDVFDRLEAMDTSHTYTAYFTSLRHPSSSHELFYARILLSHTEISDTPVPHQTILTAAIPPNPLAIRYKANDGTLREKVYRKEDEARWQIFTDFQGEKVPLEVLEEMRGVEETEGEWEGRGIEVGDEAWKVLLRYRSAQAII